MSRMIELTDAELDAVGGGLGPNAVAAGLVALAAAANVNIRDVVDIGDVTVGDVLSNIDIREVVKDVNVGIAVLGGFGQR
jgi:hypothetical protein